MSYSLAELRAGFPALDALYADDRAALHQANPIVDRVRAAMNPWIGIRTADVVPAVQPARELSPAAWSHHEISEGIDRARDVALNARADRGGLPRILGNLRKGLLPRKPGGYSAKELRAREKAEIGERQQALRDYEYELALDVLDRGGEPVGVVALHCPEWTFDHDYPAPESPAWVVPVGYSMERVARLVSASCWGCWFCRSDRLNSNMTNYLLISAGAVIHSFATCRACRRQFDQDAPSGLDWVDSADAWDAEHGYPSDEERR